MIKHLYTLKKEYDGKDIYIWDIGKKAVWVFSYLAYRGVDVRGFVTSCVQFIGDSFMNRPVISLEDFKKNENAIMIVDNSIGTDSFEIISSYGACVYHKNAQEVDPDLIGRSVYIYGTEKGAWDMLKLASKHGIACKGFLLSEKTGADKIGGIPVLQFDQADIDDHDAIIVSAIREHVINEIVEYVQNSGFAGDVYIKELVDYQSIWGTDPFPMLDAAIKYNKRVVLCCEDVFGTQILGRVFNIYGINISQHVSLFGDPKRNISDIWFLSEEDPKNTAVLIFAFSDKKRYEMVQALTDMGFSPEKLNFSAIQKCLYNSYFPLKILRYENDSRLGCSLDYTSVGGVPGWAVYGDDGKDAFRIMILGGSTSSEVYLPENWVIKMYKKFVSEGIHVCIYNGAHEANSVVQEFLRLTRDIDFIKPNIVISMSGVNDYSIRPKDKFDSVRMESAFSYWRRMESYMKTVSEASGARFISVLQPINIGMEPNSLWECLMFVSDTCKIDKEFAFESRKDDFYINLLDLFHHREGMFIDNCHYSDEANGIIADIVYRAIKEKR